VAEASRYDAGLIPTTVTYLEMTARPSLPRIRPLVRKLALMRAERPPISFYRYLYDAVGRKWLWVDRKRLDDHQLAAIIHDEQVAIHVLYADGAPAGFVELDFRRMPDANINYFGLVPEWIGRKLGSYLLCWAIDEAWRHDPARLTVNTCTLDHPAALSLYQRFGFVPYDRHETLLDPNV